VLSKCLIKQKSFKSDLKIDTETLIRTVFVSVFYTDSAAKWKAHLEKSVVDSRQTRSSLGDILGTQLNLW